MNKTSVNRMVMTLVLAGLCSAVHALPFAPRSDDEVIETLRDKPLSEPERAWRQLRAQSRQHPGDPVLAAAVARQAIVLSRRDGDPRWLGQAQGALQPWWQQPGMPQEIRLLRATILQSQHEFEPALQDLSAVIRADSRNAQAWLTQATVQQVLGRYEQAQASCQALLPLGAIWHAQACLLELQSLQGRAQQALPALQALARQAPPGLQPWLNLIEAELHERLGQERQAEALYKRLLAAEPDAYTQGVYADLLLQQGRAQEVIHLLQSSQRQDGLLLRLALAYAQAQDARLDAAVQSLRARFDAAHARGDVVHRREEARFTLHLLQRPQEALKLALANWAVQKEPADARIVLEAARAAHQDNAAQPVRAFIAQSRWRDQRLKEFL